MDQIATISLTQTMKTVTAEHATCIQQIEVKHKSIKSLEYISVNMMVYQESIMICDQVTLYVHFIIILVSKVETDSSKTGDHEKSPFLGMMNC